MRISPQLKNSSGGIRSALSTVESIINLLPNKQIHGTEKSTKRDPN